jgi:hypothetical protein
MGGWVVGGGVNNVNNTNNISSILQLLYIFITNSSIKFHFCTHQLRQLTGQYGTQLAVWVPIVHPCFGVGVIVVPGRTADGRRQPYLLIRHLHVYDECSVAAQDYVQNSIGQINIKVVDVMARAFDRVTYIFQRFICNFTVLSFRATGIAISHVTQE